MLLFKVKASKLFERYISTMTVENVNKYYQSTSNIKIIGPIVVSPLRRNIKSLIVTELIEDVVEVVPAPVYAFQVSRDVIDKISTHYTNKYLDYWWMNKQIDVEPALTLNDFINLNEGSLEESDQIRKEFNVYMYYWKYRSW